MGRTSGITSRLPITDTTSCTVRRSVSLHKGVVLERLVQQTNHNCEGVLLQKGLLDSLHVACLRVASPTSTCRGACTFPIRPNEPKPGFTCRSGELLPGLIGCVISVISLTAR